MSAARQAILAVSGYATFHSPDVQREVTRLLDAIDKNLDELNYEPADSVTEAAVDLESAMNEADQEEPVELDEP